MCVQIYIIWVCAYVSLSDKLIFMGAKQSLVLKSISPVQSQTNKSDSSIVRNNPDDTPRFVTVRVSLPKF
jgi:hypothetical protein